MEEMSLEELIEDQAQDMRRGDRVERQRVGTGRARTRTRSLDALPANDTMQGANEWDDPTFEEACACGE